MNEQFIRTEILIGKENLDKIKNTHVALFGLGGVGGQLINLIRAGISHIDLYDGDVVSQSNLNRQVLANYSTLGKNKVDVMKEMILSINPDCEINTFNQFLYKEDIEKIDFSKYQYVVDAIDTVSTKIALIKRCDEQKVNIISCLGTGNKIDATQLEITDIYKTSVCPLAKVLRHELKKLGIKKLKVCYSKETPIKVVADSSNGRHSPGSMVFVPAVAGLLIGNEIIKDIIKKD